VLAMLGDSAAWAKNEASGNINIATTLSNAVSRYFELNGVV